MKKIFSFIGSPLKKNSNTRTLTEMMLDELEKMDENIDCEILTAGQVEIKHCQGCWSCMKRGICPQDEKDDMGLLKKKMMGADFIIWGSPVYTMQVSGQMKTFLDRLSSWYHLLKMAGKTGMVVTTTANSGMEEVKDYLNMMLCATGVEVITDMGAYGTFPKTLIDPESARKEAYSKAAEVYPYISGEKTAETNPDLEVCFQVMKNKVTYGAKWLPFEHDYWKEKGMLELDSFDELLEKIR
ncbi:MAG: flavodoxin family protein [Methanobacterium sp.]|nr:flavodoxin family protein [Methanobacterium sp.]